jgi:uncharacterized protein
MNATSSAVPEERIEWIDAVRAIALFGVLIVNLLTEFRVSIFQQFLAATAERSGADPVVERIVALGFESKAFCLFALLFGIGLAIQCDRLSAAGRPLLRLSRRLAALLVFGLIHLLLVWNGDILTEYALAGFVVLPLLLLGQRLLALAALGFFALHVLGPVLLYSVPWPSAAALELHVASANQVYSSGTLAEIWRFSIQELPLLLSLHLFVFPRTVALFLFGMLLWRSGVLKRPHEFTPWTTIVAIAGIAGGAALTWGQTLPPVAPVVLALGYGAALVLLGQLSIARRFLAALAPMGRMAFTNYVLQSIVLGFVFFGYGLGQFGRMGATAGFGLGVALYVAQLAFSRWWLRRYHFGPLEWLWRTLTYGVAQPMTR